MSFLQRFHCIYYVTDETSKQLFQQAMSEGLVSLRTVVLLLIGVAGAGKTSFCHMLFNKAPPDVRESTPLAQAPVRAISISKATALFREDDEVVWNHVSSCRFNHLIAEFIKEMQDIKKTNQGSTDLTLYQNPQSPSANSDMAPVGESQEEQGSGDHTTGHSLTTESDSRPVDSEQLFKMKPVQELIDLISKSKGSQEISKQEWLYIIDTGGQPQFHELLPTFVHHVSAAVFFVKLNEKLDDCPIINYYSEGGKLCGFPYQSSQNHFQIIQNCLQAMQYRCKEESKNAHCPDLFFVGTHRDQDCSEDKNEQLQQFLVRHNYKFYCRSKNHLIYPVNSRTPDEIDKRVVADFRRAVMKTCTHENEIPIRWFVLEQLLQQLSNNGVISFKKCLEVASHLGMQERHLKAALDYFVKLNIFEYFPNILPNVVFTTSQVLLNKVTELVEYSHYLHNSTQCNIHSLDIRFSDYGEITIDMLEQERFSRGYICGLFEAKDVLLLWKELLVVAKCNDNKFIMPAVLSSLSHDKLYEHRIDISSVRTAPFVIRYPGDLFPSGIFSSLISHLQNKCGWMISMEDEKPECLHRNCVSFNGTREAEANITLIYFYEWIEVHMSLDEDENEDEQECCCSIRETLFRGLRNAQNVQKYSSLQPELAFLCNCSNKSYEHLATVTPTKKKLQCSVSNIKEKLTEKHQVWLHSYDGESFAR